MSHNYTQRIEINRKPLIGLQRLLMTLFILTLFVSFPQAADQPVNKITARATTPVITFFNGTNEGTELRIAEGSFKASIGVRLSEAASTDVTLQLLLDPLASTASKSNDFIMPDPDNTGFPPDFINITIPAGSIEAAFTIDINDNDLDNDDKTIVFLINNLVGAISTSASLIIIIADEEPLPEIHIDTANTTIFEEIKPFVTIKLELIKSRSSKDIILSYELKESPGMVEFNVNTSEGDYIHPGVLTIPAGAEDFEFNINFRPDQSAEDQEQLTFILLGADNASINEENNQVVITVIDDFSAQNKITDTGVTTCYDANRTPLASCTTDVDFPNQDGSTVAVRNLVRINSAGQRVSAGASFDCVYDVDTGLLWEVKDIGDGRIYTWYSTADSVNGGNPGTEGTEGGTLNCDTPPCDTETYVRVLNTSQNGVGHCGVRKWRVPSVFELTSLIDFESSSTLVNIDTQFFPNTVASYYWTATPASVLSDAAWCINFDRANFNQIRHCPKVQTRYLRLVSTCKLGASSVEC